MISVVPITKSGHKNKFWQRFASYRFAENEYLAPLAAAEISKAVHAMPMAFARQENRFMLVGLLSLTPGQNRFVDPAGKWLGKYVPASFRGYPFGVARVADKNDLILCVDENSGLISDTSGEPIFDDRGNLAGPVQEIMTFLSRIRKNREKTDQAVAALAEAGLMAPWPPDAKKGLVHHIEGLYKVDEAKLNSLEDEVFLRLRRSRSLVVAYAQLLSMENIHVFDALAKIREQVKETRMDTAFLNDDMISFD
jgi:hypothetical protein